MGTRSLTVIKDGRKEIVVMYRQYDGYYDGHGKDLAEFLSGFRIVNGLGRGDNTKTANGMGCLAAQIVAHFKTEPGGIYIYPAKTRDCGEDYAYTINERKGDVIMSVNSFKGTPEEFLIWYPEAGEDE